MKASGKMMIGYSTFSLRLFFFIFFIIPVKYNGTNIRIKKLCKKICKQTKHQRKTLAGQLECGYV